MARPAWMLDTITLSELIRNPSGTLTGRSPGVPADAACTSIVAACELRFGARRRGSVTLTQRVAQLLAALVVLPFNDPADEHYADIRTSLERAGTHRQPRPIDRCRCALARADAGDPQRG